LDVAEWSDFFVAQAGASAALAGLLFVGISINLEKIVQYSHLVNRAESAIALLLAILVISSLLLVPEQSDRAVGLQVLGVGLVAWLVVTWLAVSGLRQAPDQYRGPAWISVATRQVTTLPLIVAGIVLLQPNDDGLNWLVAGFIASFVVAVTDGWVLLVEIHR
jgi:modulator of FtsH protease